MIWNHRWHEISYDMKSQMTCNLIWHKMSNVMKCWCWCWINDPKQKHFGAYHRPPDGHFLLFTIYHLIPSEGWAWLAWQIIQCVLDENTKQILSPPVSGLAGRAGSSLQPHLQSPETGQILFVCYCYCSWKRSNIILFLSLLLLLLFS